MAGHGALWGALIGNLTTQSLNAQIGTYLTWSVVVFVMGIPIAIIIASYITEGVMKIAGGTADMGIKKLHAAHPQMGVASALVGGKFQQESGEYAKITGELTRLGYKRGGTQRVNETWVRDGAGDGPTTVQVMTFSDQVKAAAKSGRPSKGKVGPVKK